MKQKIRKPVQQEAKCVGLKIFATEAICGGAALEILDEVFSLSALAVILNVKESGLFGDVGDNKADFGTLFSGQNTSDDAPGVRPRVGRVLKAVVSVHQEVREQGEGVKEGA